MWVCPCPGGFTPFQPGSFSTYVRTSLASASIDLFADSSSGVAKGKEHEYGPEHQVVDQTSCLELKSGRTPKDLKGESTTEKVEEAAVMAALEAEWNQEWAAEGGKLKLFYLMREALAPLIEAVLLVDRAIYLTECISTAVPTSTQADHTSEPDVGFGVSDHLQDATGGIVRIFPLFDPAFSPRNICLFASAPRGMRTDVCMPDVEPK